MPSKSEKGGESLSDLIKSHMTGGEKTVLSRGACEVKALEACSMSGGFVEGRCD